MPRMARRKSCTKVYHVILRGNDRQDIFFDHQDYMKFIKEIVNTKEKYNYDLYAYCLMTNHVHMVIYDKDNMLSKIMQSLEVAYTSYFSKKYKKVGHLFQNRFLSKEVETKEYLINVCRYIHQNPVKAKIADIDKYQWSSYKEYMNKEKIIDNKMLLSLFETTKQGAIKHLKEFHNSEEDNINSEYEYELQNSLTDNELKEKIELILEINQLSKIKEYSIELRNEKIRKLSIIKGTSKAQIARVLGMNKRMIERVMKV